MICEKALSCQPKDRFDTASELREAVWQWLADEPLASLHHAVVHFRELHQSDPSRIEYKTRLSRELTNLSKVFLSLERRDESSRVAEEALNLASEAFQADPENLQLFQELSIVRSHLTLVLRSTGDEEAAERLSDVNKIEFRELLKNQSQKREIHEDLLSITLHQGFSVQEAEELLERYADFEKSSLESSPDDETGAFEVFKYLGDDSGGVDTIHPVDTAEASTRNSIWYEFQGRNRYRLLSVLGEGGMGTVYRARDNYLIRDVAIKCLKAIAQEYSQIRLMFLREVIVLSMLDYPNIAPIYDVGLQKLSTDSHESSSGNEYFVMKLVEGQSLSQLAADRNTSAVRNARKWDPALRAFVQVCDAIQHAHDRGIIHGDPKTSNVKVQDNGVAWLYDWGLSRVLKSELLPAAIEWLEDKPKAIQEALEFEHREGTVIGTPSYMSPEQTRGEGQSKKTDIYVLGASLYEILTGSPPLRTEFAGSSLLKLFERIQNGIIPTPREVDSSIPKKLERICLKAIAVDPSERYETAVEFASEIRRFLPKQKS